MATVLRYTLKRRFALHLAAFGILCVGALSVTLYLVTHRQESTLIDRIVDDRMGALVEEFAAGGAHLPRRGQNAWGYIARGPADREGLPPRLRDLAPGKHAVWTGDGLDYVLVRETEGARLYVAYDAANHEQRLAAFRWSLLAGLAAVAVAAAALGSWWAGVLIRQVADLAQRVDSLQPGARDTKLTANLDEEIVRLAAAFDRYQSRMIQMVEREREFSSNVGHELRTPLTLIQTSCELLMEDANLAQRSRRHVARIANAADHMNDSIKSFLVLAREGDLGDNERVSIRECVLESLEPFREALKQKGVEVRLEIGEHAAIHANREAFFIVAGNLVKNAVKYTDAGVIAVRYVGNQLYVEDTGCGIPASDIPNIFLRFYRARAASESGREGLGLGLAIVGRICEHYGWALGVQSALGQGTTVSVEFIRPGHLFEAGR